jgi:hypothetical protein
VKRDRPERYERRIKKTVQKLLMIQEFDLSPSERELLNSAWWMPSTVVRVSSFDLFPIVLKGTDAGVDGRSRKNGMVLKQVAAR